MNFPVFKDLQPKRDQDEKSISRLINFLFSRLSVENPWGVGNPPKVSVRSFTSLLVTSYQPHSSIFALLVVKTLLQV